MKFKFTLKRCWEVEKKEGIYVLSGSDTTRDYMLTMKDIELDVDLLKEKYKELFDENGAFKEDIKKTALYKQYIKEFNPMNSMYIDISNKVKMDNLKYLATILPYFSEDKIAHDYEFTIDELKDFENELLTNLPRVFTTKKQGVEEVDNEKK